MANQEVQVKIVDQSVEIKAQYSDDRTAIEVKTAFTWTDKEGAPFTVEQLREAPAKLALALLQKIISEKAA